MMLGTQLVLRVCESSLSTWSWSAVWVPGAMGSPENCPAGGPAQREHVASPQPPGTHTGGGMVTGERQPHHVSGPTGRAAPSDVMCWG